MQSPATARRLSSLFSFCSCRGARGLYWHGHKRVSLLLVFLLVLSLRRNWLQHREPASPKGRSSLGGANSAVSLRADETAPAVTRVQPPRPQHPPAQTLPFRRRRQARGRAAVAEESRGAREAAATARSTSSNNASDSPAQRAPHRLVCRARQWQRAPRPRHRIAPSRYPVPRDALVSEGGRNASRHSQSAGLACECWPIEVDW